MSLRRILCTIAALVSLASGAAHGEVVTFQFTGTITYGAPMAVLTGTPIVGTFAYDTDLAPGIESPDYAAYLIPPPFTISATVGGHTITSENLRAELFNHMQSNVEDMIWLTGGPAVLDGTHFPEGLLGIVLASAAGNDKALKGTQLPKSLKLKKFDAGSNATYGVLQINGGPDGTLLQFSIDSITRIRSTR